MIDSFSSSAPALTRILALLALSLVSFFVGALGRFDAATFRSNLDAGFLGQAGPYRADHHQKTDPCPGPGR